jgi:hypothetical protein
MRGFVTAPRNVARNVKLFNDYNAKDVISISSLNVHTCTLDCTYSKSIDRPLGGFVSQSGVISFIFVTFKKSHIKCHILKVEDHTRLDKAAR